MTHPKFVFVIPYRDREQHYVFFTRYIKYIMEDYIFNQDYVLCFVHQNDNRPFNRGALKNIGYMYYRDKYPEEYKDIQFIFHDIDDIICITFIIYQIVYSIIISSTIDHRFIF